MEIVDVRDYQKLYDNSYTVERFELLTYRGNKVVIYASGPYSDHLVDSRGLNTWHGRLPKSPLFETTEEALDWLKFQVRHGAYFYNLSLPGHFRGELCSKCAKRTV